MKKVLYLITLLIILGGANSVKAEKVRLYSQGFTEEVTGSCSYDATTKKFSWNSQYSNAVTVIKFTTGLLPYFSTVNLHVDDISENGEFRIVVKFGTDTQYWKSLSSTGDISINISDFQKWGTIITEDEIATAFEIRLSGSDGETHIGDWVKIDPTSIYLETSWDAPMSISSTSDWEGLSKFVSSGVTDLDATMTADVDAGSTMVGTDADGKRYSGTFNGAGHTLTFNYNNTGSAVAPFQAVGGATIKDLNTTGSITSTNNLLAGIVGQCSGNVTLTRCSSNMSITTTVNENGRIGGLVARCHTDHGATLTLNYCQFNGSLSSEQSGYAYGMVGWNNSTVTLNYCIVNPTSVNNGGKAFAESYTLASGSTCYYATGKFSTGQETEMTDQIRSSGLAAYTLNTNIEDGAFFFGQNLKDPSSSPILTSDPTYKVFEVATGEYANWTNTISDDIDWVTFSKLVASGSTDLDVTMTADVNAGSTMVGTEAKPYQGTFDGAGYSLTFSYNGGDQYVAPFKFVNGATISDLKVLGEITTTNNQCGGIIGKNTGGDTKINRCISSVSITSNANSNGRIGGLAGRCTDGSLTFNHCIYDGIIHCTGSDKFACGFVGYHNGDNASVTINHCLVASTDIVGGDANFAGGFKAPTTNYSYYLTQFGSNTQGTQLNDQLRYSGQAAYTLNQDIEEGAWFFGQGRLNTSTVDALPTLTNDQSKKVWAKQPEYTSTTLYMNAGGAIPNLVRMKALGWYFDGTESHVVNTVPSDISNETVLRRTMNFFTLKVGTAGATTLIVPFSTTSLPENVKAYNLEFDGSIINATEVSHLTVNKPVLINAPAGEYLFSASTTGMTDIPMETGDNAWIDYSSNVLTNGCLTGVYNNVAAPGQQPAYNPVSYVPQNAYVLQNGPDGLGFYLVENANDIKITSFRAYLTAQSNASRLFINYVDNDETSIDEVKGDNGENGTIYSISGQRVDKATRGLYITNGKKVIIK